MPIIKTIKIDKSNHKQETARQFKVIGNLRWELTDHYGYPVDLSLIRNERIDGLLSTESTPEISKQIRYSISLQKKDESGWGHYNIDLYKEQLSLYSTVDDDSQSHLRIKLNCQSFARAEELIQLLVESNNLELMPVSRADFKSW